MKGHQKQWQFLTKSAKLGKLPHALLFYGQERIGKKALAIEFAEFLIGRTSPPDFILVEPEDSREIQIFQIRNLIQKLSFKPYLADLKLAVIDRAHLMTQEAQNCFLKFLEEPKAKTFLILITEYPAMLLPTILSRVQKIRFYQTKEFKIEEPEKLISISKSDLAERFQYAKNISTENLEEILDIWLRYFRKIFLERVANQQKNKDFNQYSLSKIKNIIRQIQTTKHLISTTNTNPRLALELLLMEL